MSWTASCEIPKGSGKPKWEHGPTAAHETIDAMVPSGQDGADVYVERDDVFVQARAAAVILLHQAYRDVLNDHAWRISISGHVNAEHEPREGWANDFVNIQIIQID